MGSESEDCRGATIESATMGLINMMRSCHGTTLLKSEVQKLKWGAAIEVGSMETMQ